MMLSQYNRLRYNDGLKVCPRNEVKEGVEEGTCSLLGKKNPTLRGEGAGGEG